MKRAATQKAKEGNPLIRHNQEIDGVFVGHTKNIEIVTCHRENRINGDVFEEVKELVRKNNGCNQSVLRTL